MKTFIKILFILLINGIMYSCHNEEKKITDQLSVLKQKVIQFPSVCYNKNDSALNEKASYAVLNYVDSSGCTECKLLLPYWKKLIHQIDSIVPNKVNFLFFIHTSNIRKITRIFQYNQFDYPVCFDICDSLNKLNHFPADERFHTFLLDHNNRIKVIGNPVHNPRIRELYLKVITGDTLPKKEFPKTSVNYAKNYIDLGTVIIGEDREVVFTLKNTGKQPLIIMDVMTSCECATPRYDRRPVKPEDILDITIGIKTEELGYFEKTITVYCNAENSPIQFKIKGIIQENRKL